MKNNYSYTEYHTDTWGDNSFFNILYITGVPGSGKTSLAYQLAEDNDDYVILLDAYVDVGSAPENVVFNEFLTNLRSDWQSLRQAVFEAFTAEPNSDKLPQYTLAIRTWLDFLESAVIRFGVNAYNVYDKRVIVDGVQIMDHTVIYDINFLKDKPVIIMDTPEDFIENSAQNTAWLADLAALKKVLDES
jgi:hypothetical protein